MNWQFELRVRHGVTTIGAIIGRPPDGFIRVRGGESDGVFSVSVIQESEDGRLLVRAHRRARRRAAAEQAAQARGLLDAGREPPDPC